MFVFLFILFIMGNIYFLYKVILFLEKKNNRIFDLSDLKKLSIMDVVYNVYFICKLNDLFEFLILFVDL